MLNLLAESNGALVPKGSFGPAMLYLLAGSLFVLPTRAFPLTIQRAPVRRGVSLGGSVALPFPILKVKSAIRPLSSSWFTPLRPGSYPWFSLWRPTVTLSAHQSASHLLLPWSLVVLSHERQPWSGLCGSVVGVRVIVAQTVLLPAACRAPLPVAHHR
jgi:hypothetical protein